MFDRFLRDSPHVELWYFYVEYVQYAQAPLCCDVFLRDVKTHQVETDGT